MADNELRCFPDNAQEALALIYVQNQDLHGKTPEEIHTLYLEALYAMRKDLSEKRKSGYLRDLRGSD